MSYRLVICVDVEAESLDAAYGKVYKAMGTITGKDTGMDWESTDEWFAQDGEQGTVKEMEEARERFFTCNHEDGRCPHGMFRTGAGACPACEGGRDG